MMRLMWEERLKDLREGCLCLDIFVNIKILKDCHLSVNPVDTSDRGNIDCQ